ncbi:MAG: HlyD family type I secretion periplasmic adaptor subunit, partial [Paracoccaceae bacterium]
EQESRLIGEQIDQIENRVLGIKAQLEALSLQRHLLQQELANQQTLLDRGLTQARAVMELRTDEASMLGQIGKLNADIAELKGQIAALKIELVKLRTARQQEAISTLRDLQYSEIELAERRLSLKDTLSRLDVTAPVSGIVYGSLVFALQSVVQPGAPIMYVIPQDQPLVVAARVETINIDQVHVGQEAGLRFTAFDQRATPEVLGYVSRVSADAITDEVTGQSYYAAELLPKEGELQKLGDRVLVPGMPVEAFIKTGDRSPLTYLTKPLTDYFTRAFRE